VFHEPTAVPQAPVPAPDAPPAPAPRVLTPSALALYADCPRRYAFRHVERVPAEFHPVAFCFGLALHAAVEAGVAPPRRGSPDLDVARSRFLATFRKECAENPVRFEDGDSPERVEALGLRLVEAFFAGVPADGIVAAEVAFEVPLSHLLARPEAVVLRGRFDLRFADGAVGELKTARRPLLLPVLRRAVQLRAYVLAASLLEGRAPVLRLVQLLKGPGAEPCTTVELSFSPAELADLVAMAGRALSAIDRGRFPRHVDSRCAYCEYERRCLGRGPAA